MIEPLTSAPPAPATEAPRPAAEPARAGFAAALARAATEKKPAETTTGGATAPGTKTGGTAAPEGGAKPEATKPVEPAPQRKLSSARDAVGEGEVWKPVQGRTDRAEIAEGPRKGQYVNLSGNARDGQTFTIERKDGKAVHVYGTGAERKEITMGDAREPQRAREADPPADESWAPVKSHRGYVDISNGKRQDMFLNLSGNARHGQAFRIIERDDKIFHVYGTGAAKQEVRVDTERNRDAVPAKADAPAKPEPKSEAPAKPEPAAAKPFQI